MLRPVLLGLAVGLAYRAGVQQRQANELERATRWYALGAEHAFEALNDLTDLEDTRDAPAWLDGHPRRAREHYVQQIRNAEAGLQ